MHVTAVCCSWEISEICPKFLHVCFPSDTNLMIVAKVILFIRDLISRLVLLLRYVGESCTWEATVLLDFVDHSACTAQHWPLLQLLPIGGTISGNGCSELTLRTHISQRHWHIYASTLKNMPTSLDYEVPERENEISLFCRCSKCAHTSCWFNWWPMPLLWSYFKDKPICCSVGKGYSTRITW